MSNSTAKKSFLFLNQMAGPLFRELAEDVSKEWPGSELYTGHPDTLKYPSTNELKITAGPGYNRANNVTRVVSWFWYFICAFFKVLFDKKKTLFFVSNPPFLGLLGYFFKKIRKQPYLVMVYDIHPDILINLGRLNGHGFIAKGWRLLNKKIYENADIVFTLGEYMATNLAKSFDVNKTKAKEIVIIPPWVDTKKIKPISKKDNWFAQEHKQVDKLTILYSGNLGATHNIEWIIDLAKRLEDQADIHFLIIGDGAKRPIVEKATKDRAINLTLLPFQPEDVVPFSMATGDVAIVSMEEGTEGFMVPSKSKYYLAAGCKLLFIGNVESEIGKITENGYGIGNNHNDLEKIKRFIISTADLTSWESKIKAHNFVSALYSRGVVTEQLIHRLSIDFVD